MKTPSAIPFKLVLLLVLLPGCAQRLGAPAPTKRSQGIHHIGKDHKILQTMCIATFNIDNTITVEKDRFIHILPVI